MPVLALEVHSVHFAYRAGGSRNRPTHLRWEGISFPFGTRGREFSPLFGFEGKGALQGRARVGERGHKFPPNRGNYGAVGIVLENFGARFEKLLNETAINLLFSYFPPPLCPKHRNPSPTPIFYHVVPWVTPIFGLKVP